MDVRHLKLSYGGDLAALRNSVAITHDSFAPSTWRTNSFFVAIKTVFFLNRNYNDNLAGTHLCFTLLYKDTQCLDHETNGT